MGTMVWPGLSIHFTTCKQSGHTSPPSQVPSLPVRQKAALWGQGRQWAALGLIGLFPAPVQPPWGVDLNAYFCNSVFFSSCSVFTLRKHTLRGGNAAAGD